MFGRSGPAMLVASIFLGACGCTSGIAVRPNAQEVVHSDVTQGSEAWYEPRTQAEREDQTRLFLADTASRGVIKKAAEAARDAHDEFIRAWHLCHAERAVPGAVRPTREEVDSLLKKAKAARARHNEAIAAPTKRYQEFLERYPHNWYARHRFAWFLADHVIWPKAAEEWRKVIELAPHFPFAYNNLGSLYNHMGRDMEAVDLYLKAIELKGDDPTFHTNLAVNYSVHRDEVARKFGWDLPRVFRECIAVYRRARELAPKDPRIARDLAGQYVLAKFFGLGDVSEEEIAAWQHYLKLDLTPTQRGVGCRNIGRIYLKQKADPVAAARWLEKCLKLLDNDPVSEMLLKQAKAKMAPGR